MTKRSSRQLAPCKMNLTITVYIPKHIYKRKNREKKTKNNKKKKTEEKLH